MGSQAEDDTRHKEPESPEASYVTARESGDESAESRGFAEANGSQGTTNDASIFNTTLRGNNEGPDRGEGINKRSRKKSDIMEKASSTILKLYGSLELYMHSKAATPTRRQDDVN